ncbi:CCT domain-containing protein [Clostridioides difficile]|nr:CCT domain-containing protein [Clostridioides difficile]
MLRDSEEATAWLHMADPVKNWSEWSLALDKPSLLSAGAIKTVELVEKADDGKLAHDVDDLSAIFEGLVDGADIPLPCDDLEDTFGSENTSAAWIDTLDDDVVNVNELSAAFDALVEEQETTEDDDEEMADADSDNEVSSDVKIIPSAPVWATMAPLDPRSCIRTPVFQNLDSRIPRIQLPRMDLSFSPNGAAVKSAGAPGTSRPSQSMSPKSEKAKVAKYHHDPKTCWICKSSKTPEKKRALHRYHEKRTRRNWKRGPRYTGRSNVATSRVRNGGRFICTTRWI